MAELKDRRDALLYIAKEHRGTKNALIEKIGIELYDQFCRMGFIKKGVSVENKKPCSTWQITELGKSQVFFYRKTTYEEETLGQFYNSLGI